MGRILIPKLPGIAVASTSQVNLTVPSLFYLDGTHTKKIPGTIEDGLEIIGAGVGYYGLGYGNAHPNIILSPNTSVYDRYGGYELIPSQIDWSLWYIIFDFDNFQWLVQSEFSTNASTNPNYIPTSGWSTSITITSSSSSSKISIKKQNLGGGKLKTHSNLLSNSRFDKNNDYPFNGFDANYNISGPLGGGTPILGNYYHNSPLFYRTDYATIANKTFHEINSPYTTLLYNHALQPRLLKMFGAGSKFGPPNTPNDTNYLKTITSTTSYTPTDNQSWTKYGVEQIIAIPSWARKVKYGVKYLIISGDEFRFNNFGGLEIYFQKGINRSYVNLNMVRKPVSVDTTALDSLETLYTLNNYVNFDSAYANAMCQWLGPSTSKVKVRRRPSVYIDASNLDTFNALSDTIDIPTFSTSGGEPDFNNGFPDYISIQMFFAEWVSYLNNSGIPSGAIYFYEPFLYFTEF